MSARKPRPKPVLTPEARAAMMALDTQIAAEDAQDFRREMRRIKAGLPEPPRRPLQTFASWADCGATPTTIA
ncbi:hypothetical protein [Luteococcus sp.]|uniref:hypothetical protein n=1 Tax=Luteococcus sp. TaxID=1969402 RepID=UPI003736BB2C